MLKEHKENILKAFKSLTKIGQARIEKDGKDITHELYVDLLDDDYILKQCLYEEHTILTGRRGTGKSTIFAKATHELKENKKDKFVPVYINLQTHYERMDQDVHNEIRVKQNFLKSILLQIEKELSFFEKILSQAKIKQINDKINNGSYFISNTCIEEDIKDVSSASENVKVNSQISLSPSIGGNLEEESTQSKQKGTKITQERILAINDILDDINSLVKGSKIDKIYLFLDDFSELDLNAQRLIIDEIVAPIVSTYEDLFIIKLATYPGRFYLGKIDQLKIKQVDLDFFNTYSEIETNAARIESRAISFLERTLDIRIKNFTNNKLSAKDLFNDNPEDYKAILKLLFDCTSAVPRTLGYILDYCYISTINNGKVITKEIIDSSAQRYYEKHIRPGLESDYRYKASFRDSKKLLNQQIQIVLKKEIVANRKELKRNAIKAYSNDSLSNKLYKETLEDHKRGPNYWFPTSHFYLSKNKEDILETLELHFIISKVQENSSRSDTSKINSTYALNYGLCLSENIDYGRPTSKRTSRRSRDFWRFKEFNIESTISNLLDDVENTSCSNCGAIYNEVQFEVYQEYENCFKCGQHQTVQSVKQIPEEIRKKYSSDVPTADETMNDIVLPDTQIEILRFLFTTENEWKSAHEIAQIIDTAHIVVSNAIRISLEPKGYIEIDEGEERKYYMLTDEAKEIFFK